MKTIETHKLLVLPTRVRGVARQTTFKFLFTPHFIFSFTFLSPTPWNRSHVLTIQSSLSWTLGAGGRPKTARLAKRLDDPPHRRWKGVAKGRFGVNVRLTPH